MSMKGSHVSGDSLSQHVTFFLCPEQSARHFGKTMTHNLKSVRHSFDSLTDIYIVKSSVCSESLRVANQWQAHRAVKNA